MNISNLIYLVQDPLMIDVSRKIEPEIEDSWKSELMDEFNKQGFLSLREFLIAEKSKHTIYPPGKQIFSAFNHTPLNAVRVVILGQDPYHGPGQAHGLCFSVPEGVKPPPSLVNIFKELKTDIGMEIPRSGNLEKWAEQGVMLLNATLTVRANTAGSHQGKGWEQFTDAVIRKISDRQSHVVFMLWGRYAQNKVPLIDSSKHLILKAAHPSPLSAHHGFFGCRHFSRANEFLKSHEMDPIDWKLNH